MCSKKSKKNWMTSLQADIKIESGHISSEGTVLGVQRSLDLYNGAITFKFVWGNDTGTVTINGSGISMTYGDPADGDTASLQYADAGWTFMLLNSNGDRTDASPGHLSVYRDGKYIINY